MKIKLNSLLIDKIHLTFILFILIFAPPFLPYTNLLLALFMIIILLTKNKKIINAILFDSKIINWIAIMIILTIYVLSVSIPISILYDDIINISNYITIINRFGILTFTIVPVITYVIYFLRTKNYTFEFFIEVIVYVGLIQGIMSIAAYLLPFIKSTFIFLMSKFSTSSIYSNEWFITVRSYGFSNTLVDVFGLGIGVLASVSFFYGVFYKPRFILFSFIISISTILNSRTGLLVFFIGISITLIMIIKRNKLSSIFKIVGIIIVISLFSGIAIEQLSKNEHTYKWIKNGLDEILYLFTNRSLSGLDNSTLTKLFSPQFWSFPSLFRSIVGTGHSLYEAEGYDHSDVGYVNDVWIFGIIGILILYGFIIYSFRKIRKNNNSLIYLFISNFCVMAFLFFNIKGSVIGYNPGAVSILLLLFISTWYKKNNRNVSNNNIMEANFGK